MLKKEDVLSALLTHFRDYATLYASILTAFGCGNEWDPQGRLLTDCPFGWHPRRALRVTVAHDHQYAGRWRCFGCGRGGDLFELLRQSLESWQGRPADFEEAVFDGVRILISVGAHLPPSIRAEYEAAERRVRAKSGGRGMPITSTQPQAAQAQIATGSASGAPPQAVTHAPVSNAISPPPGRVALPPSLEEAIMSRLAQQPQSTRSLREHLVRRNTEVARALQALVARGWVRRVLLPDRRGVVQRTGIWFMTDAGRTRT